MVALALYKHISAQHDITGKRKTLSYLKNKDGKEVDFAIVDHDRNIEQILEVKTSDNTVSKALKYFSDKYHLPAVQIVKNLPIESKSGQYIELRRAKDFLLSLT